MNVQTLRIFVYGTLKRGEINAHHMARAKFAGTAVTREAAHDFIVVDYADYPYPALIPGGRFVRGEVFEMDVDMLAFLDSFEGHEYERRDIALDNGSAQAYFLKDVAYAPVIENAAQILYDTRTGIIEWKTT